MHLPLATRNSCCQSALATICGGLFLHPDLMIFVAKSRSHDSHLLYPAFWKVLKLQSNTNKVYTMCSSPHRLRFGIVWLRFSSLRCEQFLIAGIQGYFRLLTVSLASSSSNFKRPSYPPCGCHLASTRNKPRSPDRFCDYSALN